MNKRPLKSAAILFVFCSFLQACVATVGGKGGSFSDNVFNSDFVQTSGEHPNARVNYVPTARDLRVLEQDKNAKRLERNYFYATANFDFKNHTVKQRTDQDCWAACTIMLFKHEAIQFTQEDFEKKRDKLYGANRASDEASIYANIINSYAKASYTRPVSREILLDSLINNYIVLVGFEDPENQQGHIMIATGCYFSFMGPVGADWLVGRNSNQAVDKVIVVDPMDGCQKEISGEQFKKTAKFAISFLPELSHSTFLLLNF